MSCLVSTMPCEIALRLRWSPDLCLDLAMLCQPEQVLPALLGEELGKGLASHPRTKAVASVLASGSLLSPKMKITTKPQ